MTTYKYFPLIKTRDAELRCFENLSEGTLSQLLPIYELTKSRKTTKTPDGDIHRRMSKIEEIQKGKPFILDLNTDDSYSNTQISQLLSPHKNFYEWQIFLFELYAHLNIIPVVHLYEDDSGSFTEVREFVSIASEKKNELAVRIPYDLSEAEINHYLKPIKDGLKSGCKIFVLLDASYIRNEAEESLESVSNMFIESLAAVERCLENSLQYIVMVCTSFPSSPAQEGAKNAGRRAEADSQGDFPVFEEKIYKKIRDEGFHIGYGDYVSINTEQIEIKGGTFVPRIDILTDDGHTFFYKRYRRNDGSYPRCAKAVVEDSRYNDNKGWADQEIALAAQGTPTGISPAFWISVRMEYYINTKLKLRS